MIRGALGVPGPAAVWFRLERALVEGEENSPLAHAVLADLGGPFGRCAMALLFERVPG